MAPLDVAIMASVTTKKTLSDTRPGSDFFAKAASLNFSLMRLMADEASLQPKPNQIKPSA